MNFGSYLAGRRQAAKLSQRQLAHSCDLSPAYIAALERNTSDSPPLKTCKELARALGINAEEVWRHSFAARLKRWLKHEGYSISDSDILELVKRIEPKER